MAEKKESLNLYQKLLEVKKKVPYLQKDKDGHNYSYVTPSNVLGTLNPLLNEHGIILKQEVVSCSHERIFQKPKSVDVYVAGAKESRVIDVHETMFHLTMKMTWVDVATGDKDENMWFSSGVNGDEKGLGSSLTYAERYFMLKFFNIPTDSDDPDSFQEKHLTDEQREKIALEKFEVEKKKVLELTAKAKKVEDLTKIKKDFPSAVKDVQVSEAMLDKFNELSKATEQEEANVKGVLKKEGKLQEKKEEPVKEEVKELPKQETLAEILEHEPEEELSGTMKKIIDYQTSSKLSSQETQAELDNRYSSKTTAEFLSDKKTLETISSEDENELALALDVEEITVESVKAEVLAFTDKTLLTKHGETELPKFEKMFSKDEFIEIRATFREHYDSLTKNK